MKIDINIHHHGDPATERKLDRILHALLEGLKSMATRDQEVLDALNALKGDVAKISPALAKIDTDVTTLTNAVANAQQPDGSITAAGAQAILDAVTDVRSSVAAAQSAADAIDARTADPAA